MHPDEACHRCVDEWIEADTGDDERSEEEESNSI